MVIVLPFAAAHLMSARNTSSFSLVSASVMKVFCSNGQYTPTTAHPALKSAE
ncbi:hypothetical protein DPMN_016387 [Dreissena polymorpha]|uniref:Uncharacterized protein n=1 Tax=Dreissena polymorpha TaxID=45954 RepID=A0A9D4NFJ2_DREPO|nr:hypothetical protein DPMN_016387 [Dreissena polymorpha]